MVCHFCHCPPMTPDRPSSPNTELTHGAHAKQNALLSKPIRFGVETKPGMIARRDEAIVGAHEIPQKHKNEMRTTWESHVNWCAPCTTSPYHSPEAYNIVSFLFCFHFIWCVRERARRNDTNVSTINARPLRRNDFDARVSERKSPKPDDSVKHSQEAVEVNIYLSPRLESQQRQHRRRQRRTRW